MARQYQSPLHSTTTTSSSTTQLLNREAIKMFSKDWKMVCSASKQDLSDGFPPLERCWSLSGETSTSSSSSPSSEPAEDASAKRIRAKYFYTLGIGKPKLPVTPLHGSTGSSRQVVPNGQQRIRSILKISSPTHSNADPSLSKGLFSNNIQTTTTNTNKRRDSKVVFKTEVSIHLIPNRHQFSSKEKEQLWMLPQELEETAYRNYIEFSLEQWDWQQAIEENDFVLIQGMLTHPAHVAMMQQQMHCTPNRQFCRIFSAQQQHLRQHQYQRPHQYHRYSSSQQSTNYR